MAGQTQQRGGFCGMIVAVVVVLAVIGYFVRPKDTGTNTASPTSRPNLVSGQATQVPQSEPTPIPPTPVPQAEPAPPLAEIAAKKEKSTDAQWDAYAESLKGKAISGWTGTVQSVDEKVFSDDFRMIVDTPDPVPGYAFDLWVDVPKSDALNISKDAKVAVSGTIKEVDCVLTSCPIELENATYNFR